MLKMQCLLCETALLKNHLKSAVLQLIGQDRFEKRDAHILEMFKDINIIRSSS